MAILTLPQLKALWIDGFIPDQSDYADLFDSLEAAGGGDFVDLVTAQSVSGVKTWLSFQNFNSGIGVGDPAGSGNLYMRNTGGDPNGVGANMLFDTTQPEGNGFNYFRNDGTTGKMYWRNLSNNRVIDFTFGRQHDGVSGGQSTEDYTLPEKSGTIALLDDIPTGGLTLVNGSQAASGISLAGNLFKAVSSGASIDTQVVGDRTFFNVTVSGIALGDSLTGQEFGFVNIPTGFTSALSSVACHASFGTPPAQSKGNFAFIRCTLSSSGGLIVQLYGHDLATSASEGTNLQLQVSGSFPTA